MKVSNLQLFLRSLRSAVTAADNNSSLPADLEAVSAALEPFASLDFTQLASFLSQAEQYRSSGAVSVPLAGQGAEQVQTGLRKAASLTDRFSRPETFDAGQVTTEWEDAQRELTQGLATFLKPVAITIALKGDRKAFQAAVKKAETRALAASIRAILSGVTDAVSLNAPERQEKLRAITAPLTPADLKAAATELGASPSGKTKDAVLVAIVERMTGIKAVAGKTPPTKVSVDQATVQREAVKLKGLLEKSFDPAGLSSDEIEGAIRELKQRSVAELQAIAKEIDLDKAGKSKDGILKKIREKLLEVERIRESIQV